MNAPKVSAPTIEIDSEAAVACPASGLTTVATIANLAHKRLCFHFAVATQALDDFDVLVKGHPDATAIDITPANWASLGSGTRFNYSSGNLAAQAAGSSGYFDMDITGLVEITIKASGAVDNASVTPRWSLHA
jgi:hypothetical protein